MVVKMNRNQWKDQYQKAMAIVHDLYEYALISDTKEEILEYQMTIIQLLKNCNVRINDTWSIRINKLKSIMDDQHFDEKLNNRIKGGMSRFKKYLRSQDDKVQYFYRSEDFLEEVPETL